MASDIPDVTPDTAPRQRRKDARPAELIDAALALFVEKGYANTRTEDVAARAGVSKGTLYLYYASKDDLLKAVIRDKLSARIAAGSVAVDRHEGPTAELLRQTLTRWWQDIFDSPGSGVFKLIITEAAQHPDIARFYTDEVVLPGSAVIGRIVSRGIERGEFRPVDVGQTVQSLVLPMVMLCLHKHSLGVCAGALNTDPHQFIAHHVELVLQSLLNRDAG